MDAAGRDEKYGTGAHGVSLGADALLAVPAQVKEQLSLGVAVRGHAVEGLEMAVHPQRSHGPLPAAEAEIAQKDWFDGSRWRLGHKHNK
jgi:hypothetical protein